MKLFIQSLLLATIASMSTVPTANAIKIGDMNYCIVTVEKDDNGEQYTVLVPQVNLDAVTQKLDVIDVDCDTGQAPKPLF